MQSVVQRVHCPVAGRRVNIGLHVDACTGTNSTGMGRGVGGKFDLPLVSMISSLDLRKIGDKI